MLSIEYRRDLTATVAVVLLCSGGLAVIFRGDITISQSDYFLNAAGTFALFATGPFSGWIVTVMNRFGSEGAWILISLTFVSIWPAVSARTATTVMSRRIKLAVAGMFWLFSSFFYAVLIWI